MRGSAAVLTIGSATTTRLYIRFLRDDTGSLVNNFSQDSRQISHMLLSEAKAQYQSGIGNWSAGLQAQYQQLGSEKNAFSFSEKGAVCYRLLYSAGGN